MSFGRLKLGLGWTSGKGTPAVPVPGTATAQGRRSVVNATCPWRSPLVIPDGSLNKKDRQQLVYAYSDIAA